MYGINDCPLCPSRYRSMHHDHILGRLPKYCHPHHLSHSFKKLKYDISHERVEVGIMYVCDVLTSNEIPAPATSPWVIASCTVASYKAARERHPSAGVNGEETVLTLDAVKTRFGRVGAFKVDGQVVPRIRSESLTSSSPSHTTTKHMC